MVGLRLQSHSSASIGQSFFPEGLLPWAASPSDSLLSTICSACFKQASSSPLPCPGHCNGSVVYCSDPCRDLDLPLHFRSGECHLLAAIAPASDGHQGFVWKGRVEFPSLGGTCDLRVALRLLAHHEHLKNTERFLAEIRQGHNASRLGGLLSNRSSLLLLQHDDEQRCCSEQDDEIQAISDELLDASLLMHHARYVMLAENGGDGLLGDAYDFSAIEANAEDMNVVISGKPTSIEAANHFVKPKVESDTHVIMKNDHVSCESAECTVMETNGTVVDTHNDPTESGKPQSFGECAVKTNAKILAEEDMLLIQEVICQVFTNGVHVQVNQMAMLEDHATMHLHDLGTAIYGPLFSWIDHSCRPNAFYSFVLSTTIPTTSTSGVLLVPDTCIEPLGVNKFGSSHRTHNQDSRQYGPRVYLHCIHNMTVSEHVWISYVNLLDPKSQRKRELCLKYCFDCHCERCGSQSYADEELEKIGLDDATCKTLMEEMLQHESERAIDLLLTNDDPWSCCQILESLLLWVLETAKGTGSLTLNYDNDSIGQTLPHQETPAQNQIMHLMHHKCLDIYTSLTTSYKILASINEHQDTEMSSGGEDINFCLASAAYALVLVGFVQTLYESGETGLIGTTALLWQECGEAFLRLTKQLDTFYGLPSSSIIDAVKDVSLCVSGMTNNRSKFEHVRNLATSLWPVVRSVSPFLSCIPNLFSANRISSVVVDSTEKLNTREIWILHRRDVLMFIKCCFEYSFSLMNICHGNILNS